MAANEPNLDELFRGAVAHHRAGQLTQAAADYERVLARVPAHAEALHLLGVIAAQSENYERAFGLIRRAIALRPDNAEYHSNLCLAFFEARRFNEAVDAGRRAVGLAPNNADVFSTLGPALREAGKLDDAIACFQNAIRLRPNSAELHRQLGAVLRLRGRLDASLVACRRSIELEPLNTAAHCGLGTTLKELGLLDEAIASQRRAIALKPELVEAHVNLGNALTDRGDLDEAIPAYEQAIRLNPDFSDAHLNLGIALLLRGDFARGWHEYEWRTRGIKPASPPRKFLQPQWDGSDIAGRTILLHAEQGLGDTLQFVRYVPLVAPRAGRVIVECQPSLAALVRSAFPGHTVVATGEPLPAFDVHCPLFSLPLALRTTPENIPQNVPYLHAGEQAVNLWRERLSSESGAFKIGLVWAGSQTHGRDRHRSTALASLAPLARVPGVAFYSLQKGPASAQIKSLPPGFHVIDHTDLLRDFSDTAGLMANLDLLITVDTSAAHLAGAMGRPVWTMLAFAPDWRWGLRRTDSAWYPSMRLFRQPRPCDWLPVIEQIAAALLQAKEKRP